jgi:hypothetical protein
MVSPRVAVLTEGVLKTMFLTKLKAVVLVLVLVAFAGGCLTAVAQTMGKGDTTLAGQEKAANAPADPEKKGVDTKTVDDQGEGLPAVDQGMVDKAIRLEDGDWLVYRYRPVSDSGAQVYRMDSTMSKRRWYARCKGLGQSHEQFGNKVDANVVGTQVVITCHTQGGEGGEGNWFVERLELATGKQIERKVARK